MRRRGYTRLSRKLQANFPKEAVEAAGLRPGDELRAEAVGPGEIRFVRVSDPLEVLDELAHEFAGMYPSGYLAPT
jgi:bifunctional DNA-binding transcriptional regulator/antitoxin component of YhaV-PrlF toxin-antitoxin module